MTTESNEMSILGHILELRKRLILSMWGILIGFGVAYSYSDRIYDWIMAPLCKAFEDTGKCPVIYTGVAEPFLVYLKVGLVGGIFFATPWIFFQVWKFISPGLKAAEKRYVVPFVFTASTMFVGGALLGYYFIFPMAFPFFREQAGSVVQPMLSMEAYLSFASGLLFAFGILFEIPVFVILLNFIGILHSKSLWKTWRPAVAVIFILAAVFTPADPYTMLLVGVPLASFYLIALVVCSLHDRLRSRAS